MSSSAPATPRFDQDAGVVRVQVDIAATPERVFEALTDPRELAAWWGDDGQYRTRDWRVDARPGGEWSTRATHPGGEESTVRGTYLAVEPPRLLEYTWRASWEEFAETTVRFDLVPVPVDGVPGTRLTVTHTGFRGARARAGAGYSQGWVGVLGWLEAHVVAVRVPSGGGPAARIPGSRRAPQTA